VVEWEMEAVWLTSFDDDSIYVEKVKKQQMNIDRLADLVHGKTKHKYRNKCPLVFLETTFTDKSIYTA